MSEILMYNLSPQKEAKLKMLCREMYIQARTVQKDEYGFTLAYLLGLSDNASTENGEDFSGEMLYISGLRGGMLNLFLDRIRRKKLTVPLKAIQTDTNLGFSSYELYRELSAEREAITKGKSIHLPDPTTDVR